MKLETESEEYKPNPQTQIPYHILKLLSASSNKTIQTVIKLVN